MQRAFVTVTQEAIRVCGGRAFLKRYPLERYPRDARAAALMRPWTQEIAIQQAWEAALGLDGQRGGPRGRDRTSVGCEKDGAAVPPMITTPRADRVRASHATPSFDGCEACCQRDRLIGLLHPHNVASRGHSPCIDCALASEETKPVLQ